jgi:polyhydroxybutyrate depolymerase
MSKRMAHDAALGSVVLVALLAACSHGKSAAPDARREITDAPAPGDGPASAPDVAPSLADAPARDTAPPVDAPTRDVPSGTDTGATSAGCTAAGLPEGDATVTVGGMTRAYRLHLPAGYTAERAWPLVLALHPNGSDVGYWDSADRHLRATIANKAIVVLAAARAGDWRGDLPADLAYFDALIARLESNLCVDTQRIFSMGFSGGGSFSGCSAACARTSAPSPSAAR